MFLLNSFYITIGVYITRDHWKLYKFSLHISVIWGSHEKIRQLEVFCHLCQCFVIPLHSNKENDLLSSKYDLVFITFFLKEKQIFFKTANKFTTTRKNISDNDLTYLFRITHWQKTFFVETEICQPSFYKCKEGHCISSKLLCDGKKHCMHGDDELFCGKHKL